MHIPPHFKKIYWQHALIGAIFGGVIAYGIVMFMYGTLYEDLMEENLRLEAKVTELNAKNKSLKEEDEKEKEKERLTVDTISVTLSNSNQMRLDRLTIYQLEELVKTEIDHLIGQNVAIIGESVNLVVSTLENKRFHIDDVDYYVDVERIIIGEKLSLSLQVKMHQ